MTRFTLLMFLTFGMSSSVLAMEMQARPEAPDPSQTTEVKYGHGFATVELNNADKLEPDEQPNMQNKGFQKIRLPKCTTHCLEKLLEESQECAKTLVGAKGDPISIYAMRKAERIVGLLPWKNLYTHDNPQTARFFFYSPELFCDLCYAGAILQDSRGYSQGVHLDWRRGPREDQPYWNHYKPSFDDEDLLRKYKHLLDDDNKNLQMVSIWTPLKNYKSQPLILMHDPDRTVNLDLKVECVKDYDESHEWYYYPEMESGDAILHDVMRTPHTSMEGEPGGNRISFHFRPLSFTLPMAVLEGQENLSPAKRDTLEFVIELIKKLGNSSEDIPELTNVDSLLVALKRRVEITPSRCCHDVADVKPTENGTCPADAGPIHID